MLLLHTLGSQRVRFWLAATIAGLGLVRGAAAQVCFDPDPAVGVGYGPRAPTSADLDGDGDLDLVVANVLTGTVSILLNQGNAVLAGMMVPVGNNPFDVACADFDGDGDVDVATANNSTGDVSVLLNNGNATFAPHVLFPAGVSPWGMTKADLNSDGAVDLAIADYQLSSVLVLMNQGDGTFGPFTQYAAGGSPQSVVGADLDGDGDLDLAVANAAAVTISVLLNHGNGTFAAQSTWTVSQGPVSVKSADLDGDGDLDLVSASSPLNQVSVLLNLGNATFAPRVDYTAPGTQQWMTNADLDGDGDVDLVVPGLSATAHGTIVLLNHGNGTFAGYTPIAQGTNSVCLTSADLDGDGDIDLAGGVGLTTVAVLRNCATSGIPFCAGDGTGTSCPCGNDSTIGSQAGCLSSFGLGATLRGSGRTSLSDDHLVLDAGQLPESVALFFQGTVRVNGGAGAMFGDGLRCAGGTVVRLATKFSTGGVSHFPEGNESSVSVRGMITTAGERSYQVRYRNAATFCTPSTFNLTNGLTVTWMP